MSNYNSAIYSNENFNDASVDKNNELVDYALSAMRREECGRIVVPLLWRGDVAHLLSNNFNLSKNVLFSNFKKLSKIRGHLQMVDQVFKDQEKEGIIEKIPDLNQFMKDNPAHSFLSHMAIFRLDRATTKCRVVFLSNLSEAVDKNSKSFSHNMAMYAGPNLNLKITSALMHQRFGEVLLSYDIRQAFLNLLLGQENSNRLAFLWFKDITKENYELVGYRNLRLKLACDAAPHY